MPFLWGFSPGRTALLLVLLFFRTCDPTDSSNRVPRLFSPTDPSVSFGWANLLVIGEDTNGTVQTLLENVGLRETLDWERLFHFRKDEFTASTLSEDTLEEQIFKLRDFGSGTYVHNSTDCVCTPLKHMLRPFPFIEGKNGEYYHPFLVVVSLVTEPCPGLEPISCHDEWKENNGVRLIYTSIVGGLLDTNAFEWMKEKENSTTDPSVAVEFPFLAKEPNSADDWKNLADAREKLNDDLNVIANKGNDGRIPNATCEAPIPPQEDCEEVGKDECKDHTNIYEDDTDCTTEGPYCRECFVKRTTTTSSTTTTTRTTTTTKNTPNFGSIHRIVTYVKKKSEAPSNRYFLTLEEDRAVLETRQESRLQEWIVSGTRRLRYITISPALYPTLVLSLGIGNGSVTLKVSPKGEQRGLEGRLSSFRLDNNSFRSGFWPGSFASNMSVGGEADLIFVPKMRGEWVWLLTPVE